MTTQPAITTFIAEHLAMLVRLVPTLSPQNRGVLIANLNVLADGTTSLAEATAFGAMIGWATHAKRAGDTSEAPYFLEPIHKRIYDEMRSPGAVAADEVPGVRLGSHALPKVSQDAANRASESLLHYFRVAFGANVRVTDDMVGEIRSIITDIIQAARGE